MSDSHRCPTCEGRKFIVGFGGIRKPCTDCKTQSTPKKMGRPKKEG